MNGRRLAVGLLAAVAIAIVLVFWLGVNGNGGVRTPSATTAPSAEPSAATSKASPAPLVDAAVLQRAVADRRARDELRRRIYAGWAASDDSALAAAAREGRLPEMPTTADGGIDPQYIRSVFREDMLPMAQKCYEELVSRQPDAGGRVELFFKIVGDDKLGGIIEEADVEDGGTDLALQDPKMATCLRESLLSLSFRPPPHDGWVTVRYPLVFAQ